MIRRLLRRLRQGTATHATVGGSRLGTRTAKSLGLSGNTERHDHVELTDDEKRQVADMERRWDGGER